MIIHNNKYPVQSQINNVAIAPAVAAAINTNAVADSVKNKVAGITERLKNLEAKSIADAHQVKDAAGRFQTNFGHVSGGASAGTTIDSLRSIGSGHSRNPIGQQGNGFVGDRNSRLSEDPKTGEQGAKSNDSPDWWGGVKEAFGEIVGEVAGAFGGAAWDILSANDTPEGKKDEANGIIGVFRQGKTGTSNENAASQLKDIDYGGEPLPDDQTPSGVVYGHDIKGINARKGAAGEPTGDEGSTGGPVNTGASGTGRQASLGQPVPDAVAMGVAITARDIQAIQIRLDSKINVIR